MADEPTFRPGDIYEDCAFHPCLCVEVIDEGTNDEGQRDYVLLGISLIDATYPRSCSTLSCGPTRIPIESIVAIRSRFASYVVRRQAELSAE